MAVSIIAKIFSSGVVAGRAQPGPKMNPPPGASISIASRHFWATKSGVPWAIIPLGSIGPSKVDFFSAASLEICKLIDEMGVGVKIYDDTNFTEIAEHLNHSQFNVPVEKLNSLTREYQFAKILNYL